ncbi:hypothetical protein ACT3SZ_13950, partial [Corynebacterium sp. AOP40-9SA-29]
LLARDPETWGFLAGTNAMVYTGLLTCAVTGFVFYLVGRTPVIKWVLHPPALPRRTPRRTREAVRENVAV